MGEEVTFAAVWLGARGRLRAGEAEGIVAADLERQALSLRGEGRLVEESMVRGVIDSVFRFCRPGRAGPRSAL